jgi:Phage integrase, N-terminal SAM-like domain
MERVRHVIAARHYSRRTEGAYVGWLRRFIAFHAGRPCEEMGAAALLFAYRDVLGRELEGLDAIRAKPSVRLPVVLSREEVTAVLRHLRGTVARASASRTWTSRVARSRCATARGARTACRCSR